MTADEFRHLALELPEASESAHMGHPDFRVGGKIFATLGHPDQNWGMVKLTPAEQQYFVQTSPKVFKPVKGAWGRQGCTIVRLRGAKKSSLLPALVAAWRNRAPKRLVGEFDI